MLSGADGQPVSGWPFRVGSSHDALPLVTQLDGEGALDIVGVEFFSTSRFYLLLIATPPPAVAMDKPASDIGLFC